MEESQFFKENTEFKLIYLKTSTNYSSLYAHNHMKIVTLLKKFSRDLDAYEIEHVLDIDRLGNMYLPLYRLLDSSLFLDILLNMIYTQCEKKIKIWNHTKLPMKCFSSLDYLVHHQNLHLILIFLMKEKK